ncbi:tetratricopeptide repeat protein [Pseudomonas sp. BMS12]|uniref:tetratricopeptide repeat protein n=1 Tax=Pseudomonas sp. BMS12 TaxID=1796033 RepID=UPI00083A8040|nr:tetratricopeptide repeat protein [Pseudomonas sp. BMS12]
MRLALALTISLLGLQAQAADCPPLTDFDDLHQLGQRAEQGDSCTSRDLARYYDSQGVDTFARYYYQMAASQGDRSVDARLLEMYLATADAGERSLYRDWLEQAAVAGVAAAQREMGSYLLARDPDEEQRMDAMHWFELAAKQADRQAQFLLAEQYWSDQRGGEDLAGGDERGAHFASDDNKALSWLCKSALAGYPRAQFVLSEAYSYGRGMPSDQEQRHLWLEKAAAGGDADAIVWLDDSDRAWYTRAENWLKRQLSDAEARCPDSVAQVEQ